MNAKEAEQTLSVSICGKREVQCRLMLHEGNAGGGEERDPVHEIWNQL